MGKCVKPEKGVEEEKEEGEVGVNATSAGETEEEAEAVEEEAAMTDTAPLSLSFTWLSSSALPQHLLQKKEAAMREESKGTTSEVP